MPSGVAMKRCSGPWVSGPAALQGLPV
ncbi:rCG60336 [Rattus norvegicus]|uniref:RCG60336 n=1 Tax=Rattus norvegicus TaxID=10116 RepID=A6KJG0_RAT|nr:rCG60336 [Rattus norvegicus]